MPTHICPVCSSEVGEDAITTDAANYAALAIAEKLVSDDPQPDTPAAKTLMSLVEMIQRYEKTRYPLVGLADPTAVITTKP